MTSEDFPKTLQEAAVYFGQAGVAFSFLRDWRWPNGVCCPRCNGKDVRFISTREIWECKACAKQKRFSVRTGTVFEDSPLKLDKWLLAFWLLANAKNGISSYEVHRALGITQKSAWFVLHRVRLALKSGSPEKLSGVVEADETYVGGLAKNMHRGKRRERIHGRGGVGKAIVSGLLEREGRVHAQVVVRADKQTLHAGIKKHVAPGSSIYTDTAPAYEGITNQNLYTHAAVNHLVEYVRGEVHTNGLENFWCHLKRSVRGTYVAPEPFHLQAYVTEQCFRFNERLDENGDAGRFVTALKGSLGRHITYKKLIGDSDIPMRGPRKTGSRRTEVQRPPGDSRAV